MTTTTDNVVISVQRPGVLDVREAHLERGLLVGPRTVVAPGEHLVEVLRDLQPVELLLGPPAGGDGPVERMEPAFTHVWWLTDAPLRTLTVAFRLPRATFHDYSRSLLTPEGIDLVITRMRRDGADGFFAGAVAIGALSDETRQWPTSEWFQDMTLHERRLQRLALPRSPFDDLSRATAWHPFATSAQAGGGICEITGKCFQPQRPRPWDVPGER